MAISLRMRLTCVVLGVSTALASVHVFAGEAVSADAVHASIQHDIDAEIAAGRITGVSVAVVRQGAIVWEQGFGWADKAAGRKATSHTPFSVASTTKPFTTTALMTLVAAGKIDLDKPANDYLGAAKIVDEHGSAQGVTARLLATHSAGMPSLFAMYPKGGTDKQPSVDHLLKEYGHLVAAPGEHYEYSNLGMAVIADIVARRAGMEYGAYLKNAVLAPLGMRDSFFDTDVARRAAMAVRYSDDGRPLPFYLTATPGSGEVMTSAHDLARFAMFHLKDHLADQQAILDDAQIDELHRPHTDVAPGFFYGMGWQVLRQPGRPEVLYHGGGQTGVDAEFVLVPSADVACVVLSNRHADQAFIGKVRDRLLQSVLPSWSTLPPTPSAPPTPLPAKNYAGTWRGTLSAQGHSVAATLVIDAQGKGSFSLEGQPTRTVTDFGLIDGWITGDTLGDTGAPDAHRARLEKLNFNLKLRGGRIDGETVAWKKTSDNMTVFPFWTVLTRSESPRRAPQDVGG